MNGLQHIRLELAREKGAPAGDHQAGYDLVVPLDGDGHIDAAQAGAAAPAWRLRQFAKDQTVAVGSLRRASGGRWVFHFEDHDEAPFHLADERFVLGEYVSVKAAGGETHTYRVTQLQPV